VFKLIDKIRKKDNRSKTRTAFTVSLVITLLIGIIWGFSFYHRIKTVVQESDSTPSILESISLEFQKTFEIKPFSSK
jgi:hypothetical protein